MERFKLCVEAELMARDLLREALVLAEVGHRREARRLMREAEQWIDRRDEVAGVSG